MASDGNGYVNSNNCGTAIQYAARNGAHVINCSWGSTYTSTMSVGMSLVDSAGVNITHAAGNEDANNPDYLDGDPGNIEVLAVASVAGNDVKSSFSNYGFWVDVSAYGDNILMPWSSQYSPTTTSSWGTSFAAPMVAGLAALIRSAMPSLTKEQVDSIIINTADDINDVNPSYFGMLGSGRIDAGTALSGLANARFIADVYEGEAPLSVQFTDQSPYSPTSWTWSFGTGDSAYVQNPLYIYTDPGIYDVSLIVDDTVSLGPGEEHLKNLIWVTADTLKMDSVTIERGGSATVDVRLSNTSLLKEFQLAFTFDNDDGVDLDSFSVVGTRTDYFEDITLNGLSGKTRSIEFIPNDPGTGSDYLPADTGSILRLFFSAETFATPGATVQIDTTHIGTKTTYLSSIWGELIPEIVPGKIVVNACGRGDVNCSGSIDVQDLVYLVSFMFGSGLPPDPWYTGDVNGDGSGPAIDDLVYLASYMFGGGPPPPPL
jgi:PKD repeat protein